MFLDLSDNISTNKCLSQKIHAERIVSELSWMNSTAVVVCRGFQIAVSGKGANKFPLLPVDIQGTPDIDWGGGEDLVDNILHAHGDVASGGVHVAGGGVYAVVKGNKANLIANENIVQIVTGIRVMGSVKYLGFPP